MKGKKILEDYLMEVRSNSQMDRHHNKIYSQGDIIMIQLVLRIISHILNILQKLINQSHLISIIETNLNELIDFYNKT